MSFGRLQRTPVAPPMSEINMTPLVDVMLVLVVILIVTAPLLVNAVKVALPKAASAQAVRAPRLVVLTLDRTGQAFLADQAVNAEALAQALRQAAQRDPATEIQLHADASVPYGRVVEVMDVAHHAGLSRIGFVAGAPARVMPAPAPAR